VVTPAPALLPVALAPELLSTVPEPEDGVDIPVDGVFAILPLPVEGEVCAWVRPASATSAVPKRILFIVAIINS
jgi:hypothetical protein